MGIFERKHDPAIGPALASQLADLKIAEVPVEADYHGEHTSHALGGAAKYALQTFKVLGQYILAKIGRGSSPIFKKPDSQHTGSTNSEEKRHGSPRKEVS